MIFDFIFGLVCAILFTIPARNTTYTEGKRIYIICAFVWWLITATHAINFFVN